MGDRHDDAETEHLGGDTDTDYLGEPQYTYTEEEREAHEDAVGAAPADQAETEVEEAPLTKEEQDQRVRRVAAVGTIAGLLVGAVVMLVVIALTGGDPEPEDEVAVDEGELEELETAVEERDAQIEGLEAQLSDSQAAVEERDAELDRLRQQVGEEETELAEQEAALEDQRAALERRASALDEREQALDQRESALAEREAEPPAEDPPAPDPGDDLPQIDEDEAQDVIERIIDGVRDLFN